MIRGSRDHTQYAFDFSESYGEAHSSNVNGDVGRVDNRIIIEFVDAKTRSVRLDAIRRVKAQGIFRVG